jgi:hypothetical protein
MLMTAHTNEPWTPERCRSWKLALSAAAQLVTFGDVLSPSVQSLFVEQMLRLLEELPDDGSNTSGLLEDLEALLWRLISRVRSVSALLDLLSAFEPLLSSERRPAANSNLYRTPRRRKTKQPTAAHLSVSHAANTSRKPHGRPRARP